MRKPCVSSEHSCCLCGHGREEPSSLPPGMAKEWAWQVSEGRSGVGGSSTPRAPLCRVASLHVMLAPGTQRSPSGASSLHPSSENNSSFLPFTWGLSLGPPLHKTPVIKPSLNTLT